MHNNPPMPPPDLLSEVFARRQVWDEAGAVVPLSSNVSAEEAALLRAAVIEVRPRVSLEVGFAQGVSTLAILGALRTNGQGHHHVLDPFQANYGYAGRAMVARAGLAGWYTFHERHAEDVVPTLPALQFAFIDSSHLFDLTIAEFVLADRRLEVGGVIGFHDMWMESQQCFIRYVLANRSYSVWTPAGTAHPSQRAGVGWRGLLRGAAGRLPYAQRLFAPDFLRPWSQFGLGNLVLLRKTADDARDWRFHQRF